MGCQRDRVSRNLSLDDLYGTYVGVSNTGDTIEVENINNTYYLRSNGHTIVFYSMVRIKDVRFNDLDNKIYMFDTYNIKNDTMKFEIFDVNRGTIYFRGFLFEDNEDIYIDMTIEIIPFYERYKKISARK
jgi:hypothetical protein